MCYLGRNGSGEVPIPTLRTRSLSGKRHGWLHPALSAYYLYDHAWLWHAIHHLSFRREEGFVNNGGHLDAWPAPVGQRLQRGPEADPLQLANRQYIARMQEQHDRETFLMAYKPRPLAILALLWLFAFGSRWLVKLRTPGRL